MLLSELMKAADYTGIINRSGLDPKTTDIHSLCCDSRKVSEDSVFVCISGSVNDGHDHAWGAYGHGCRVFVIEHAIKLPDDAFVIAVKDTRVALAQLSAAFYGYPAREMTVIGITGTKGKTTSSIMIYNVLRNSGISAGYIGSNGIYFGDTVLPTINTTPESIDLHCYMRQMLDAGVKTLVMEVSSQALKMARVHGIRFKICVFTNLSPDHIGEYEHADFNEYKECKRSLFTDYGAEYIVYNADDEHASSMIAGRRCKKASISLFEGADFYSKDIAYFRTSGCVGVSFTCVHGGEELSVSVPFPGEFSVYNALTAMAVCAELGLSVSEVAAALEGIRVKGRFETYELPNGATAVIDYAHNGVSLKAALQALRIYEPKRLICLFGSIGGRTRSRRAELGLVASRDADFCILTSDNPDNESPLGIISEIAEYFTSGTCPYIAIPDRREAVEYALKNSESGDIILLAGKGHESYQMIKGKRESFSEAEIIREFCEQYQPV
ncbi:MAG: UDP-N-acetylmuramoyl-L-alanyl-D-glutamate--2,6-diaminopimelate ligase [Clostridia bacterium]|nr:UDP-N-acetylmuramoyl-L-alanyl-D-glutamate--2,6-diaminopimelate ligase [Clostridia bacterium]